MISVKGCDVTGDLRHEIHSESKSRSTNNESVLELIPIESHYNLLKHMLPYPISIISKNQRPFGSV